MSPNQAAGIFQFVPLILIFAVFYFLIIRPQKGKEKEHQGMLDKLSKNNDVVTTGGIHGTIVNVKDKTVILRIDENVKVEIDKNCVAYVKNAQEGKKGSENG